MTADGIVTVPLEVGTPETGTSETGAPDALPAGAPAEAWARHALYRARPDAAAIARAQPPSTFAAAAGASALIPLYCQAAWLGR